MRPSSSRMQLPGCGSPENWRWRYMQLEVEAEDDLADPVALGLGQLLHLLKAAPGDELADDHALAREPADHVRHDDERVAVVDARDPPLVLRLELVVELLLHAAP